ncbi:MAG: Txe/YoeB family addiction module toxin [Bacilli bacterium]|jgi:toxin YoeB|nr:Txe/YoeB family addiction module toxin [Bacilli bacterium]
MWTIKFTKNAKKDKVLLKQAGLEDKVIKILGFMLVDPLQTPPQYEKLLGDLDGYYSRRINIQHRLIYRLDKSNQIIIVHSMWSHYE